jgi:hypothetical protein
MATSNSQRLRELRKKREEENKSSSSSKASAKNSDRVKKLKAERTIGFDTFESDLKSIGNTISGIYGGWQTQETMANTKSAVESMYNRINAYQEYNKMYGNKDSDLSELFDGYKSVLDDWDNLASTYGHYQNADAYNKALQKTKFDKDFAGLTYDEVQAKKKEYGKDSAEYDYLSNYTNYTSYADFNKALADVKKPKESTKIGKASTYLEGASNDISFSYGAMNSAPKTTEKKEETYADKLEKASNLYKLDNIDEKWLAIKETEGFAETSKYKEGNSELYEYINNVDGARAGILSAHDRIQAGSPIYTPSRYVEMGLDAMTDEEIGIYNTLYAQDKANDTKKADEYLKDIEKVLTKRISDKNSDSIKEAVDDEEYGALNSALLSIASPIMNIGGGIYGTVENVGSLLKGETGNPYSIYNSASNMASDIRTEVGENIAENTQGMDILGVNVPSFLYNTGMSIADSALGAYSLGKAYTPLMGMSAYQQTAKELTEAGASEDEIAITSLVSGLAEAGFEYAGIENLFKLKNSDGIKSILTNTLKQMGVEAGEEIGTEIVNVIADTWIRKDSEYKQMYEELIARGFSEQEASLEIAKDIGGRVAQAGIGGALSGGVMGGVFSTVQHHDLKSTGAELRANDRTQDMMDMFTPEEAETYKLYSEYANKGVTAENISDAQLGNLYATKSSNAYDTYASRKSTAEQKEGAMRTLDALSTYRSTPNTKLKATGEKVDIEGMKKVDGETVLVTSGGEVSTKDVTLSTNHAELISHAESMSEEKANLFLEQYDGTSNVEAYKDSFEMAYAYGETGFGADSVLKNKGVLTEAQASAIYKSAITNKVAVQQKAIDEINAKYGKTVTVAGKFDDSIIDYNSTNADGSKVNWNSLTSRQRDAITFAKGFSEATGVNITFIKSDVVDGKRVGKNGSYNPETNSIEIDVYAGVIDASAVNDSIIPTLSHEMTHWMKAKSPAMYSKMREYIMETLAMDGKLTSEERVAQEMERIQKNHPDAKVTEEMAIDEIMARACEDMLSNSDTARKMLGRMSKKEQNSFISKVKETFDNIMKWVNELLSQYKSTSKEAEVLRQYKDRLKQLSKMWDKALAEAVQTNQSMQNEGMTDLDIDVMGYDGLMYNLRAEEMHKEKLEKNYSEEADIELDALMERYNKILDIWKKLGGELNSQFLEEWDNKVGKDRTFTIFKAQAGYKYNVELSSMCKKGVPLFEAIDKIITKEIIKELKTDTIGKAEKEILYEILKNHNFEIPCAICYVEQARQKEGNIINAFIDGKIETNAKGNVTYRKIGWNQTLEKVQEEMKANGVDYTFPSLSRDVATDNYSPADISMDEETQIAFYNALKKLANEEIKLYNKEKNKNRPLIKDVTPSALKVAFKGKLPDNIMLYKTLFNEPSSRFMVDKDLLYSSATTQNLSMAHHEFYKLFNTQGGVNGYKTKQGTVVYWGDMLSKTWKPSTIRSEGGIRNQSNSDFQMYTLLDQAQMYIDFSAKGYYLQAYTKVLAELKLFGLSNGKINASLIPKVVVYKNADGTIDVEKTMQNAGLDEKGNPIFDDIEGVGHKEAFMLIEDAEYSKSICGVCIGYSDNHISTLLDDSRVQLIIGFHDKTDDGSKRYKGARYATNYNGRNEATRKNNGETLHIGFNQFIKKAEGKFKYNDKTGESLESVTYNGKTYEPNDIPRLATDLYLEHCESKGLNPAYSQGGVDFSKHPNYYKLLADFGLYDSQGNYAPHKKVTYNMPDQVPYLDKDGNKAYMKTEDYIKQELEKELLVRDSIAEALADQSEDGIIPQFINRVNEMYSDRDSEGTQLSPEQVEFFKDSKVRWGGKLLPVYHGTKVRFTEFKPDNERFASTNASVGFNWASKDKEYAEGYSDADYGIAMKGYLNITNPLDIGDIDGWRRNSFEELAEIISVSYDELISMSGRPKNTPIALYEITGTKAFMNRVIELGYDGVIAIESGLTTYGFINSNQFKNVDNTNPTENADIRYSDRDNVSVYEAMGEAERLANDNLRLKADIDKLKSTISDKDVEVRRFRSLADYLNKLAGSKVDRETLGDSIKEIYNYIQTTDNLEWVDVVAKTYDVANTMLNKSMGVPTNYFKEVMANIRKEKVSLSPEQIAEAEKLFGSYSNFHKAMFGRINIVKEGTSLDDAWSEWSKKYPGIFKANLDHTGQIQTLVDITDALRATSSLMGEYEREEAIRHLSTEIYNQLWNIASDTSKATKEARASHRELMQNMRKEYEERQKEKTLHPTGETALKYEKLLRKMKEKEKREIKKAKELGKEKMDDYKDRVARKQKIERIKKNSKLLMEYLEKNTKNKHITDDLKGPVRDLLVSIDYATRNGGIDALEQKEALAKVEQNVHDARKKVDLRANLTALQMSASEDEMLQRACVDFSSDIEAITESLRKLDLKTDTVFVLKDMSLEDVTRLDRIIRTLKAVITRANYYGTLRRKITISASAHELFDLFDSLGEAKEGKLDGVKDFFDYDNVTPVWFFDRLGPVGKDLFQAFVRGQSRQAFNIVKAKEFSDSLCSDDKKHKWDTDLIEFEVIDAKKTRDITKPVTKKVYTTTSRLMTLYLHDKREQSQGHLYKGGGGRFTTFEHKGKTYGEDVNGVVLTPQLVKQMLTKLDPEAKEVADKISVYLNTVCKNLGNEVTRDLYDVELFLEPKYIPIEVIQESVSRKMDKSAPSITALLNKGFTKETKPNAKNQIVLDSIFDVFAKHTAEMITYNAYAREVYDAVRLFEYNENRQTYVLDDEEGQTVSDNIQIAMRGALGSGAVKYFRNFLEDINGTQQAGRGNGLLNKAFSNSKLANVAWNMNVAILQPLALCRAMISIHPKYLAKGLFGIRSGMKSAMEHSGTAIYKSLGYYDTDISLPFAEQIKGDKTFGDKMKEWSMWGAGFMDKVTWGALWKACEHKVLAENKGLTRNSDGFYDKVVEVFDETVYRTQVMDSVLSRSQIMRDKNLIKKGLTSFMAEPLLSYNTVYGVFSEWNQYSRQGHSVAECSKKCGKKLAVSIGVYCISSLAEAGVRTLTSAMRGAGDDEEKDENVFLEELLSALNPLSKIPVAREIVSAMQGYGVSKIPALNTIEAFVNAYKTIGKIIIDGEEVSYKKVYKLLNAVSSASGHGISNAYRDIVAIWNSTIGQMYPSLIIKTDE